MKKMALQAMILVLSSGGSSLAESAPSFLKVDVNYDGGISESEAAKVKGLDFATADVNKDGKLSPAEYRAATKP